MERIELTRFEARLRRAYELSRLGRALAAAAPFLVLTGVALLFAREPHSTLAFGLATTAAGTALFWYGRSPARGVLPGAWAGLVPLVSSLCANSMHHCAMGHCSSWCVPACTAGGVLAGFWISDQAVRRGAGPGFWLGASLISLTTGAMGCACLGAGGIVGLLGGYIVGATPRLLLLARRG